MEIDLASILVVVNSQQNSSVSNTCVLDPTNIGKIVSGAILLTDFLEPSNCEELVVPPLVDTSTPLDPNLEPYPSILFPGPAQLKPGVKRVSVPFDQDEVPPLVDNCEI